jgi:hypothetical protein
VLLLVRGFFERGGEDLEYDLSDILSVESLDKGDE